MVSTWHSKYIVDSLSEDFEKHFANKTDTPLISHLKVRIKNNTFKFCIKSLFPRR